MAVYRASEVFQQLTTVGSGAIKYLDTVWDDMRSPASAVKITPATSKPDSGIFPAGASYTRTLVFDSGTRETVTFLVQTPHGLDHGTVLKPHVHYSPTVTDATSKTITWELNYSFAGKDEVFPGETTLTATYTGATVASTHMILGLGDIPGVTRLSTMIVGALSRRGDTDTYGSDVALLEFDIHIEIIRPGTNNQFS